MTCQPAQQCGKRSMEIFMKVQFTVLWVLFLLFATPAWALGEKAKIGQPAPDFTVQTIDGKVAHLKDYAGKNIVLEWYSSICPCCNGHYTTGSMQALQKKYTAQGVVWLTISSHAPGTEGSLDPALAKSKILKDYKATPTAILLDHDGKMGTDYGASSTPEVYLINAEGNLVYKGALDNKADDGETYSPLTSRNFLAEALEATLSHQKVKVAVTQSYGCDIKFPVNDYTLKN